MTERKILQLRKLVIEDILKENLVSSEIQQLLRNELDKIVAQLHL